MFVVQLGEIFPNHLLVMVNTKCFGNAPIRFVHKPLGVFTGEWGIDGAVIEHQVDHQLEAGGPSLVPHLAKLLFRGRGAVRVQQCGIEPEVIRDRV